MKINSKNDQQTPLVTDTGEIIFELVGLAGSADHDPNHSLAQIVIPPGKSSSLHYHKVSQETYFILEGEGQMTVNEVGFTLQEGQTCLIEPGEIHQISNMGEINLVFLAVCVPAWVPDDSFEV
ncbi:MAG: cupin domain-containing protein [Anaerolineales bacterium]|nr:cupin domain-containing protein [Anaerolineales bacterium]